MRARVCQGDWGTWMLRPRRIRLLWKSQPFASQRRWRGRAGGQRAGVQRSAPPAPRSRPAPPCPRRPRPPNAGGGGRTAAGEAPSQVQQAKWSLGYFLPCPAQTSSSSYRKGRVLIYLLDVRHVKLPSSIYLLFIKNIYIYIYISKGVERNPS